MRWVWRGLLGLGVIAAILGVGYSNLFPPRLPVPPQKDLVISGVTVINPGQVRKANQSIVVEDGSIVDIRDRQAGDPEPLCPNCFAVPGLIDAHVHTPPRIAIGNQELFALLYLRYGVTSVRDVGQSENSVAALAAKLNGGKLVGPRMYRCGPIIESPPTSWPLAKVVTNADEGRAAVEQLAGEGADCIKVYNELTREAFDAIADAARERGLPLIGHVPHVLLLNELSDFESQHFTGVPYLTRPRPPHGTDFRDEDVQDMGMQEIESVFDIAKANNVSFTPTLANLSLRLTASDRSRFPPSEGAADLPTFWAGAWNLIAGHPKTEAAIALRVATQPLMRALAAKAREKGVDVLAGTDTLMPWVVPGEALHLEMAALAEAFGDSEAALTAATHINGTHIDEGVIGGLNTGARADILLLADDPIEDLNALRDWKVLIADGRLYARDMIDAWTERYRRHFRGTYYTTIMGTVVGWVVGDYAHVESEG